MVDGKRRSAARRPSHLSHQYPGSGDRSDFHQVSNKSRAAPSVPAKAAGRLGQEEVKCWHPPCDRDFMIANPSSSPSGTPAESSSTSREDQVLHSLQDLPVSVGQVSTGPLFSVARKDHISWNFIPVTDPAHWYGRFDCALGNYLKVGPIRKIAACVGIGAMMGLLFQRSVE